MNPFDAPLTLSPLGKPVVTSRLWTDALVPRAGGGWNWIGQFYNYPNDHPTEWVVMNLETGVPHIAVEVLPPHVKRGHYANEKFGIRNQLRAPNGRVFFPAISAWWWYYDPTTGTVVNGGRVQGSTDSVLYSMVFNHDGSMLYGGTLGTSQSAHLPEVLTIDPVTLNVTPLCPVGSAGHTLNAYAYYLCADGDWLYVLVGEDIWDVVAVHVPTKTQTILKTSTVNAWAEFERKPEGMTVKLQKSAQPVDQFWVADGNWYPYVAGQPPPFAPRDTTPYVNPLVNPPQIDESLCPSVLKWRPFGSTGAWTKRPFSITYTEPIPIESLLLLPDGSLLGDVEQYQGFFRFEPASEKTRYFGKFKGITEGRSRLVVGGKAYISGYPNAPLWEYHPNAPWVTTGAEDTNNPKLLGHYSNGVSHSGVKRSEILAYSSGNNRLYMAGLRDRSGHGAGIGYYDFAHKQFAGLNTKLNFYVGGLGLVVFDNCVVFGGTIGDDPAFPGQTPTVAELVLYDLDLIEIERQTPVPGLLGTGALFRTGEPTVVVGLSSPGKLLYRWDIVSKQLLKSVTIASDICIATQGPTGTITAVLGSKQTHPPKCRGRKIVQIDPLTLVITTLGTLDGPEVGSIVQRGHDLYLWIGAELYAIYASPHAPQP